MPYNTLPAEPLPDLPAGSKYEYATIDVQFGDGYNQEGLDGVNNRRKSVELTWTNLNLVEFNMIKTFIESHAPVTPFWYTAHGDTAALLYTCKEWTDTQTSGGHYSLTAPLRQWHG